MTSSKWDIAWKDVRLSGEILGKGNFGEVQLGKVKVNDRWIKAAVKTLKGKRKHNLNVNSNLNH